MAVLARLFAVWRFHGQSTCLIDDEKRKSSRCKTSKIGGEFRRQVETVSDTVWHSTCLLPPSLPYLVGASRYTRQAPMIGSVKKIGRSLVERCPAIACCIDTAGVSDLTSLSIIHASSKLHNRYSASGLIAQLKGVAEGHSQY